MNFGQPISPKGQKRRSKGFGFELKGKSGGPEFKSHQKEKKNFIQI